MQRVLLFPTMYQTGVCNSVNANSQKSSVGHPTKTNGLLYPRGEKIVSGTIQNEVEKNGTPTSTVVTNYNIIVKHGTPTSTFVTNYNTHKLRYLYQS
jgi:hypothetical protein